LQLVRERSGKSLHDVLRRLCKAVHQTDDAAVGVENLREKDRQNRIKHLGGDIGKETRECEEERAP